MDSNIPNHILTKILTLGNSIHIFAGILRLVICGSYRGWGGGGGGEGGSLARFTGRKDNESRITDIKISISRITKISKLNTLLSCSYAKKKKWPRSV